MTAMNLNETTAGWRAQRREPAVQLYVTGADGDTGELVAARVAGLPLDLRLVPLTDPIDPELVSGAAAAVVQVQADEPASVKRFQKLASATTTPLIAAAYDPPLALVRTLLRAGAQDVLPLPLSLEDLETALSPIQEDVAAAVSEAPVRTSKLVSVIKSVGGAGATSLLGQLAIRFARAEAPFGREACLIDLDIQFGDAAFQLGLRPNLSLADLFDAGSRLDGALLRATATAHPSGLQVIASPPEMMPLDAMSSEQLIEIVDQAEREFGTVFLDLPANWTNWSLSLLARSDLVLLIAELNLSSLNRARRQLDLINSQDLGELDLRVVLNRYGKRLFKPIRPAAVRQALGREVAHTVADDPLVMRTAVDQGIPITSVKRKSAVGRDIDALEAAVAAALKLER